METPDLSVCVGGKKLEKEIMIWERDFKVGGSKEIHMVRKQDGGTVWRKEIQTNGEGGRRSHVGGGNLAKLNGSKSQTKSESEKRLLTRKA